MPETTILLLVSDSEIRNALSGALKSAGYNVLAVSNVSSAADWLRICKPCLLIVRHYTQSGSGHDAAVYLRRLMPGIPVLIVGGILDESSVQNREALHGFEIFPKPFRSSDLIEKVKEVLAKRAP